MSPNTPALLVVLLAIAPATALAQPTESTPTEPVEMVEARQRFDRGVEAYARHDFAGALGEFQRAYRLRPHPSVLVNLANCELELGRNLEAARHFEQFLRDSSDASPEQREEVERTLARAKAGLASLAFLITPAGSTITFDREALGQVDEQTPVTVSPGRHVVRAVLPGYLTAERIVTLDPGQRAEVVIDLIREDVAHGRLEIAVRNSQGNAIVLDGRPLGETPWGGDVSIGRHDLEIATERGPWRGPVDIQQSRRVEVSVSVPEAVSDDREPYLWVGGVVTAGCIAGAAISGVLALSYLNGFDESAHRVETGEYIDDTERNQIRQDAFDAADAAEALSVVADALWVGAVAMGAATTAYWFAAAPVQTPPSAEIRLAAGTGRNWVGLLASGRFR
jgi:hypothetical protein